MKTTNFLLAMIAVVMISFVNTASAQKTKKVRAKKITRNWVWVPVSPITDMSLDGRISDTGKNQRFYKESLTFKKKIRGGSYTPKKHGETSGYFMLDASFSPPRGVGVRTTAEIKFLPSTKKEKRLFIGMGANIFLNQFNVHTWKEEPGEHIEDKSRFSAEIFPSIGITKVQFIPLYIKFSLDPLKDSIKDLTKSSFGGWKMERFGIGLSVQLPEVLPTVFNRGYISLVFGKTFFHSGKKEYYSNNTLFIGAVSYIAKDFNWCSIEGTFSGGVDLRKQVPAIYYDASLRVMINLISHGNGWYSQIGGGVDFNDANRNGVMLTLRLVGPGKNKNR